MDAVANERVLHGANDRDTAGDGCFEVDRSVHFLGNGEQLDATLREQGLVARDYRFFSAQGGGDYLKCIGRASDQFYDNVHCGI